jgi:hypothetical protein
MRTSRNDWKLPTGSIAFRLVGGALLGAAFFTGTLIAGGKDEKTPDKQSPSKNGIIQLDDQVRVRVNGGVVEISSDGRKKSFTAQFKHDGAWIPPGKPSVPPESLQTAETNEVTLRYEIPGNRRFLLKVATLKGTPGAIVTGALENQGKSPVMEYYFWTWSSTSPDIVTPTGKRSANSKLTSLFDPTPWKFVLEGAGDAGWALSTDCVVGRGATTSTSAQGYLYPVERFQAIAPGGKYTASFAVAWVPDAKSAEGFANSTKRFLKREGDETKPKIDYGKPAPDWARSPSASGYYRPSTPAGAKQWAGTNEVVDFWSDEVIQKQLKPWPWVVGSQPSPEVLKRMQAAGIPLLYYVVFSELLDTSEEVKCGNKIYPEWDESLLHEERDLSKHPDWITIDESGKKRRAQFGLDNNRPGLFNTCFHQKGLMEAIEKQIRALMELGYNGVFVDVAEIPPECHGPQFGIHEHAETNKTNFDKYMEALDLIYRVVKEYGPDRIVVLNESRLDSHWRRADSLMWENCIYDHTDQEQQLQSKAELIAKGKEYAKAVSAGKVLFQLSYAGKKNPWQRSIYTYCYARLFGFTWSDWNETYQSEPEKAVRLYSLRLGEPLAEATEMEGGVWRRDFPHAIVLWNGDETPASVNLAAQGKTELRNFSDASILTCKEGIFHLTMPAHSGMILQEIEK